jgi:Family of unknown function (DUF6152)
MRSKIVLKSLAAAIVMIGLLMGSVPASGHHGTGISYDLTKLVTSKGVIVSFAFRNPHAQLYWDVKDEKGEIVHWSAEMNAPSNLERAGWNRSAIVKALPVGEEVTVTGFQSKSGAPVLVFSKAVTASGAEVKSVGGPGNID